MNFTLSINGAAPVDVKSIGGRVMSRRQLNQKSGSLRLEFTRRLGQPAPPIVFGDIVRVWLNGRGYFAGTAGAPTWRDDGGAGSFGIDLHDPWQGFEQLQFVRGYGPIDGTPSGDFDPGYVNTHGTLVTQALMKSFLSSRTMLGMTGVYKGFSPVTDNLLTLGEQALEVVRLAKSRLAKTGGLSFVFDSAQEAALAALGELTTMPEEISNMSCAAVLTKVLRWYPDAAVWWDYSTVTTPAALPTLRITVMSSATPETWTIGRGGLVARELTVRDDMRPAGVVMRFESPASTDLWRIYNWFPELPGLAWPATAQANNPRVLAQVMPVPTDWPVTPSLAQEVYDRLAVRVVEGTLTRTSADLRADMAPGLVVELAGDAPSWPAGGRMYVQDVTDSPASGTQTVRCGYPGHLGVTDFESLGKAMALSLYLGQGWGSLSGG